MLFSLTTYGPIYEGEIPLHINKSGIHLLKYRIERNCMIRERYEVLSEFCQNVKSSNPKLFLHLIDLVRGHPSNPVPILLPHLTPLMP